MLTDVSDPTLRVQCLSQMLKLFVLVNKLNFTVTLCFYYATCILRGGLLLELVASARVRPPECQGSLLPWRHLKAAQACEASPWL